MTQRMPVSAVAAEEIKEFALRFAKELQSLTGLRIRGRKLYDAFVKPIGYDSFNDVINQVGRSSEHFRFDLYFDEVRRTLRKHLPVLVDGEFIEGALAIAKSPGALALTIDCRWAPPGSVKTLTGSVFYKTFREQAFTQGRRQAVQFVELLDLPLATPVVKPIEISLDYRRWKNERDPLQSWGQLNSFIRMVSLNANLPNGVDIEIVRITRDGNTERLIRVNEHGIFEWEPRIHVIDIGPAHQTFAHSLRDRSGEVGKAIGDNIGFHVLTKQSVTDWNTLIPRPSTTGKSFAVNPFDFANGAVAVSLVRTMLEEETAKWSPPERIAGEMLLNALADVIDDYKANEVGELNFKLLNDWLSDIPLLLGERWLSSSSRNSLTVAYEEAKAAGLITALRLNGLLPYTS